MSTRAGGKPAILIVTEHGVDLEWAAAGDFQDIAPRPPRFGVIALPVSDTAELRLRTRAVGRDGARVRLQLHCNLSPEIAALPLCTAAPLSPLTAWLARDNSWCRALSQHAAASDAARRGDNALALTRYREAAASWRGRGDVLREGAALLGGSEILNRLARHEAALAEAAQSAQLSTAAGNAYFVARAGSERCLALRELGRREEARRCQQPLAESYLALAEIGDAANAYISLGSMAQQDGDVAAAEAALAKLAKLDQRTAPADVLPRARLLRATLHESAGRLSASLAELDAAAAEFEAQRNGRWQANVYLRVALLYAQLGAWEESRLFAAAALEKLPVEQAPARRAEALQLLAAAQGRLGMAPAAQVSAAQARALYDKSRAPLSLLSLDLDEALLRSDETALARATGAVAGGLQASPRQRARLQLAQARAALSAGDLDRATSALAETALNPLLLADYLQRCVLLAQLQARRGDPAGALASLEQEAALLRARAAAASAPALRHIAGRRLLELRAGWIDLYAATAPAQRPDVEAVWRLLQLTQPALLLRSGGAGRVADAAVDRALSAVLLQNAEAEPATTTLRPQRELLRYYAAAREPAGVALQPLAQTRALLPAETQLLAYGFGDAQVLRLRVTRDTAAVDVLGAAAPLREAAAALRQSLASAAIPVEESADAVAQLSGGLLPPEAGALPPRLLVFADDSLDALPFALLQGGDGRPLVESTAVTWVPAGLGPGFGAPTRWPAELQILTAAQSQTALAALPPLPGAGGEARLLREILPRRRVAAYTDADFTRARLSAALAEPDSWLHVAAHGLNDARLQSYSGLWLSPPAPGRSPVFVSWLDLVERPVQAQLLVLNACDLAGGQGQGAGPANFATALNAAGARHVVASRWPLGDAAGLQFARTFYSTLDQAAVPDPAAATLAAQQALRASPHFRHPYYWSLFVHLQH